MCEISQKQCSQGVQTGVYMFDFWARCATAAAARRLDAPPPTLCSKMSCRSSLILRSVQILDVRISDECIALSLA